MGREIFYCANCGARILPEEFESGEAIALNNQNYCPNCKPLVAPEMPAPATAPPAMSAGEAPTGSSALRRAVRAPLPTMTTGRGGTGLVGRHQTTSPLRSPALGRSPGGYGAAGRAPAKSNSVLFVVLGAGAVVLILILALAFGGRSRTPSPSPGTGGNRPNVPQPVVQPPTKADFERLRSEVYDLLKNGRKDEARSRMDAYKSRFPGFDLDRVQKLSDEIEVW